MEQDTWINNVDDWTNFVLNYCKSLLAMYSQEVPELVDAYRKEIREVYSKETPDFILNDFVDLNLIALVIGEYLISLHTDELRKEKLRNMIGDL